MKIIISGLRIAATAMLCAVSTYTSPASWDSVNKDAFKSLPLQSFSGINLKQTKNEIVSMALRLGVNEHVIELSQQQDKQGNLHSRYQQTYQGLPVWGQHITVHERAGQVYRAKGKIARGLNQELESQISSARISTLSGNSPYLEQALKWLEQQSGQPASKTTLSNVTDSREIYLEDGQATVVHVISFLASFKDQEPHRPVVIVQESNLEILKAWNQLAHVEATGPGGNIKTGRYEFGTDYGYLDVTEADTGCVMSNEKVYTVDLQNGYDDNLAIPFEFPCYENINRETNGAYSPLNDAHYFGNLVFDMYQEWFGLAPLTFQLALKVHFGEGYENAYWDGQSMVFGDGGTFFYPLVDSNVVSHEVSHGFTEQNSNLFYYGQSGGINEAFSDIAGEAAEYYLRGSVDWLIGAAITKNSTALRYFIDPTQDGVSIGNAADYQQGMDVHHSSGVFNRAYYLIASADGWNPQAAFSLFVHANRFYWEPTTNFEDGSCGVLSAATDLGYDKRPVLYAFAEVGVYCLTDNTDTDEDGMPDAWEWKYGLDVDDPSDALGDLDTDGVNNVTEYQYQSNPTLSDSDGDNLNDSDEIYIYGTSPVQADTDSDEMRDDFEIQYGLDPFDPLDATLDLDGDGSSNLEEFLVGTDPTDPEDYLKAINFLLESFEAEPGNLWQVSSDSDTGGWASSSEWSSYGNLSYAASGLSDNESATLKLRGLFEAGTLSFHFFVSTETCCDRLYVYVDGTLLHSFGGHYERRVSIDLDAGIHTIEFTYRKSIYNRAFDDTVWIDAILFETDIDHDADGMSNQWELTYKLDPQDPTDAALDLDGDGATNMQEFSAGSNPTMINSDSDNLTDGDEINIYGTSPILGDTDGDKIDDGFEVHHGLDPLDPTDAGLDLDGDGSTNLEEYQYGTDPTDPTDYLLVVSFMLESFETQDLPSHWESTSNSTSGGWAVNTDWFNHGSQSYAASGLNHSEYATLQFTGLFSEGTFSFAYKTSTQSCCDRLYVYVDGSLKVQVYGLDDGRVSLEMSEGLHTIQFTYRKNGSISNYEDTVWIDSVLFETDTDVDDDGMTNQWELVWGLDIHDPSDAALDKDGDGATNLQEFEHGSNPLLIDSDGDGLNDGDELNSYGTSPILTDSDEDEIDDGFEVSFGLDPLDPNDAALDMDGDGSSNLEEFRNGTNPSDAEDYRFPISFMYETFESELPAGWEILGTGSAQWQFSEDWQSQGIRSLKAEGLAGRGSTTLRFGADFADGVLSFDYRTRLASCCHSLRFYVDGVYITNYNSYGDIRRRASHHLSSGYHIIEIVFYNSSYSTYENFAWLDLIMFEAENTDIDSDGRPNLWELQYGFDPEDPSDRDLNSDTDELSDIEEYEAGTNPLNPDSDGDGAADHVELANSTLPNVQDTDKDGMWDGFEINYGLDPNASADANQDQDGDQLTNFEEFKLGTDPTDSTSAVKTTMVLVDSFEPPLSSRWKIDSTYIEANWKPVSSWSSDGDFSIATVNVPHYTEANLEMTALFSAGTLSFDYRILNTSTYNRILVYVDNILQSTLVYNSGRESLQITPGVHTIRFMADKPQDNGKPSFYLDNLVFLTSDTDDIDNDGMSNTWELEYKLDPEDPADAALDQDEDGATNLQEFSAGTIPILPDSDGDTLSDGEEINVYGSNPLLADSDDDEMDDAFEVLYGLDPNDPSDATLDLDGDGTTNLEELQRGTNPTDPTDFIIPVSFMYLTFEEDALPAGWEITSTGSGQWEYTNDWSSQGARSLKARDLESGSATSLRFSGWLEAGTLHVDFRTRIVPNLRDNLQLSIDGVGQTYSNSFADYESNWQYTLGKGFHTIEIIYNRNADTDNPSAAWVDLVWFESGNADVDADDLPNAWELRHNLNPQAPEDRDQDLDLDELTNFEEYSNNSNPRKRDSDGDGADDSIEVRSAGTLVNEPDSDSDRMTDGFEIAFGLNPLDPSDAYLDADADGLSNLDEFRLKLNPLDPTSNVNPTLVWLDSFENGLPLHWTLSSHRTDSWATSSNWSSHGEFSLVQENMPCYSSALAEFTTFFAEGSFKYDYNVQSNYQSNSLLVYVDGQTRSNHTSSGTNIISLTTGVHTIGFLANAAYYNCGLSVYVDNIQFLTTNEEDLDGDGIPNSWEVEHGLDPSDPSDGLIDPDFDGLTNLQEYEGNTDPFVPNVDLKITMAKVFETISNEVKYRVRVTNLSQVNATNVVIINTSQSNLYINSVPDENRIATCRSVGRDENCTLPILAAGEEVSIDLVTGVSNSSDKHVFISSVAADEVDYDTDNNEASGQYTGSLQWIMLAMLSTLYWSRRKITMRR